MVRTPRRKFPGPRAKGEVEAVAATAVQVEEMAPAAVKAAVQVEEMVRVKMEMDITTLSLLFSSKERAIK